MKPANGAVASEPARDELTRARRPRRSPDAGGPRRPAAVHADDARRRGARRSRSTGRARSRAASTTAAARRRSRSAPRSCSARATGCASCTATSAPTSSAASPPTATSPTTWAAAGGVTGGKDGNMHFGDRELGCVGMVSMLPDMALVATGHGARVQAARRAARGDDLLRRGLDRERPVARGDELRRRPPSCRSSSCSRTTGFAYSTPERARVRGRPGRARGDLRLPGRARRRQRRRGGVRGRRASPPSAPARATGRR